MENDWIIEKTDRAVAKIRDKNDKFIKSVIIPTELYPLNNNDFRVFHWSNTKEITDVKVLELIDKVKYQIGHCYQNTTEVVDILRKHDYNVKSYVGWLFVGVHTFPVHHCWAVINDNEVIDLADDFSILFSAYNIQNLSNIEESRKVLLDFEQANKNKKNTERCGNLGKASSMLYYVGSECEPNTGRRIYRELIDKYPSHECQRNCDAKGLNGTQKMFAENGLIDLK